jgi:hypothetical protein
MIYIQRLGGERRRRSTAIRGSKWQHPGNILAAGWQRPGSGLAANWQRIGSELAADGQLLAAAWQRNGDGSRSGFDDEKERRRTFHNAIFLFRRQRLSARLSALGVGGGGRRGRGPRLSAARAEG